MKAEKEESVGVWMRLSVYMRKGTGEDREIIKRKVIILKDYLINKYGSLAEVNISESELRKIFPLRHQDDFRRGIRRVRVLKNSELEKQVAEKKLKQEAKRQKVRITELQSLPTITRADVLQH